MTLSETARLLANAFRLNPKRATDICINTINRRLRPDEITGLYRSSDPPEGRVLMSYMTAPYHSGLQLPRFQSTERQSSWQARELVRAFNELGYVVDVFRLDAEVSPPNFSEYDVLFGLEPNFERYASSVSDDTTKIYYATGMHWSQRNPAIRDHIARLEHRNDVEYEAIRLLPETDAEALADALIVIGDDRTVASYTDYVGEKPMYQLYTSTYDFLECAIDNKSFEEARSNLLWFSGGDLASKGLDETLEVISDLPDVDLYVCGPLETDVDFVDVYYDELFESRNVHPIGWVDVGSTRFRGLTERCGYMIHTGYSEGFPGSVAHCMARGVVPMVTPEVIEDTSDWGISIPDHQPETIRRTIEAGAELDPKQLKRMAKRTCSRADQCHSREAYSDRIRDILQDTLRP